MRTLKLTLKRRWFDMIASGEKREEYRTPSEWILSRLEGKEYDAVEFRNGYSKTSPVVTCEFKGWKYGFGRREWGGGSTAGQPLVVIELGNIIPPTP